MKRKRRKLEKQLIEMRKRKMFLICQGMVPKKRQSDDKASFGLDKRVRPLE